MPRFVFDYLEGGAEDENGLRRNLQALEELSLVPERLNYDMTNISLDVSILGSASRGPMIVAPIGLAGLFWREGDITLAKAARRAGIPFVLSTASTCSLEEVSAASDGEKWFQLYVFGERSASESLMRRAQAAGYSTLVLTIDVPVNGNRERDIRNGFTVPFVAHPRLILDVLTHPRWLLQLIGSGMPRLANFEAGNENDITGVHAALLSRTLDSSLTWHCIDWIRAHWRGPIVLKGILSAKDAVRARDCGASSIVVSNHGGRQLDALPATVDVLAPIVSAVGSAFPVLLDSGIRRGADVVKALALGAHAVLVGRPLLYGLAAAGESGVHAVLDALIKETSTTLALMGVNDIRCLNREHVGLHGQGWKS